MKVGIIYGWSEGKWHGKLLRKELHAQGFTLTSDLTEADVPVAHSGGSYLLPEKGKAGLVMLVGIPWHSTEHPLKGLVKKVKHEIKDLWWYKKTFYNTFYFLSRPPRWLKMYKAWKAKRLPKKADSVVIAVRNNDDHFMHPVESGVLASERGWKLKNLEGHHDDLWMNPKPYVQLLKEATSTFRDQ